MSTHTEFNVQENRRKIRDCKRRIRRHQWKLFKLRVKIVFIEWKRRRSLRRVRADIVAAMEDGRLSVTAGAWGLQALTDLRDEKDTPKTRAILRAWEDEHA